jgi:hypothetical protein
MNSPKQEGSRFWPVIVKGRCAGHLLSRGLQGIEAFSSDDKSIGLFKTASEAAAALAERVLAEPAT